MFGVVFRHEKTCMKMSRLSLNDNTLYWIILTVDQSPTKGRIFSLRTSVCLQNIFGVSEQSKISLKVQNVIIYPRTPPNCFGWEARLKSPSRLFSLSLTVYKRRHCFFYAYVDHNNKISHKWKGKLFFACSPMKSAYSPALWVGLGCILIYVLWVGLGYILIYAKYQ